MEMTKQVPSSTGKVVYLLDRNHVGIRIAVLLVMIVTGVLGLFVVMPALLGLIGTTGLPDLCLSLAGAMMLGVGAAWAVERGLRAVWPSGRVLVRDGNGLQLRNSSGSERTIVWDERINILSWHFVIQRGRTWVPKGWYCLAFRLTQDDDVISVYTFMKPDAAKELPQWSAFEQLISRKAAPKRGEEHLLKLVAEQGQLRGAEHDRWQDGAEMQAQDFVELIAELDSRCADWPLKAGE